MIFIFNKGENDVKIISCGISDKGTVLKVISVPKESWNNMEELLLEELEVFKVRIQWKCLISCALKRTSIFYFMVSLNLSCHLNSVHLNGGFIFPSVLSTIVIILFHDSFYI